MQDSSNCCPFLGQHSRTLLLKIAWGITLFPTAVFLAVIFAWSCSHALHKGLNTQRVWHRSRGGGRHGSIVWTCWKLVLQWAAMPLWSCWGPSWIHAVWQKVTHLLTERHCTELGHAGYMERTYKHSQNCRLRWFKTNHFPGFHHERTQNTASSVHSFVHWPQM